MNTKKIKLPASLQKGDTIAIVAPAGVLLDKEEAIAKAKATAESWGLHVKMGAYLFQGHHHFAATDQQRTSDMQAMLDDPSVKAIWAARGGYGSVRILDQLDFSQFVKTPKWLIGYSDFTSFHSHLHTLGIASIHAMMGTSFDMETDEIEASIVSLNQALFGKALTYQLPSSPFNRCGEATGVVVGGNLSILQSMLGSVSSIDTRDSILFIEEIGEYKYAIDRMLQSLKRAGYFKHCKGVIVGGMTDLKKNTTKWGSTIEALILDVLSDTDIPVLFDFPAGHDSDNRALIFGGSAKMVVRKDRATIEFISD